MGYGDELVRVTIGFTAYVVYRQSEQKGSYDIHATGNGRSFRFFGMFEDPKYLDENELEKLVRNALRMRTGIPG